MEAIYRKVSVKDRTPKKAGFHMVEVEDGASTEAMWSPKNNYWEEAEPKIKHKPKEVKGITHWLEEIDQREQKEQFWKGFEFACRLIEDMGYDKTSTHPYNIADCLRGKMGRLSKKKIRKNKNGIKLKTK